MPLVSTKSAKNAKTGDGARFAEAKNASDIYSQVVAIIRLAWPKKTSANVAYLTGVSERSVQFWLAGETRMSVEHIASLLKTDAGFDILAAIMGDAKPSWWVNAKIAQGLRASKRAIALEMRRTEELRALQEEVNLFDK